MKKKFLLLLLALTGSTAWSTLQAQVKLVVQNQDGTAVETALDEIRTLQFQQDGFRLNGWDGQPMSSYSFSKVRKIVFSNTSTGVGEVVSDVPVLKAKVKDRLLKVEGWNAGTPAALAVYSVSGTCAYRAASWNGEEINLSGLPVGVYLLKVNQETLKFILR